MKMANIDLSQYGITGTTEVVYNPSYEMLFEEETKETLEGYEKGQMCIRDRAQTVIPALTVRWAHSVPVSAVLICSMAW